jgi:outer membrane protein insertion porin family
MSTELTDLDSSPKQDPLPCLVVACFGRILITGWMILIIGWMDTLAMPAHAGEPPAPLIESVQVKILDGTPDRREKLEDMALKMIRIRPGDRFSAEDLDTAVSLLKQTRQFSRIHLPDPDMAAPSITLKFHLTPAMVVRHIQVNGAFPVFSQSVIKATDYKVGDPFIPEQVEKNSDAVRSLMADRGYVDAVVEITAVPHEGLQMDLVIDIEKNTPLRTVDIDITGNTVFSDTRLKMRMKSWQLPVFFWSAGKKTVPGELAADIRDLTAFYRKKGYAEADITHDIETDIDRKTTRVTLHIQEGPRYRVRFSGNTEFSGYTLKKDLTLWTKGNRNDFGLRRSIKNIKERYLKAGYRDCEVSYTDQVTGDPKEPVREVTIQIRENTRYLVRTSRITGSDALDASSLKTSLNTRGKGFFYDGAYVGGMADDDRQTLENIYAAQGFEQTRVSADVTWDDPDQKDRVFADVVFDISEGDRRHVTKVLFQGLPDGLDQEAVQAVVKTKKNAPFITSQITEDRMAILSYLAENGYIYADVSFSIEPDGNDRQVIFQVTPGTKAFVGGVWVFGNFDTRDSVIFRHSALKEDEPVSLNAFLNLQKEIRDIQCLEWADFKAIGIQENLEQVFFLADVEEKKPFFLETSIGYDTARDAYLSVSAGNRNLMGTNRRLYLDAAVSGIGYGTVMGLTDYDFLSKRIYSDVNAYASEEELKNQTFGTRKFGTALTFEKQLTPHLRVGTRFNLESREQYATGTTDGVNPDVFEPRGIIAATPFFTWSSVDSHAKPTRGLYFNASAGYTRDVFEDLDNFAKYQVKAKYYIQPFSRLVLAFQGIYGTIQNFSADADLPDDQRFFLGGISDVRGFDENELVRDALGEPVGGKTQMAGSIEARIDLGNNFELPVFLDAGALQDTTGPGSDDGFKFTLGSGLRYMTPVGPVGLLYGYRLNPETGEDSGRVHFSIGYTF